MDWFKKHADAVVVIGAVLGACLWMNGRFNEVDKEIGSLRTDMAVMKTVLIMKEIMPTQLAAKE